MTNYFVVSNTGTCGQDPYVAPFFFFFFFFLNVYNKSNQTVVSIHAGFLTTYILSETRHG